MNLRRLSTLSVSKGVIASYIHGAVSDGLGKIGVLVALESEGDVAQLSQIGRQVAMHIAATNPLALEGSQLDPQIVEREKAILADKNAGKPAMFLKRSSRAA